MLQNFLKAGFARQQPMSGIPGTFPWILLALLAVAAVPFAKLQTSAPVKTSPPPTNVVRVETKITTEGRDSHQRALPFTVYVLSQELSWKLMSTTDLEGGQTLLSPEVADAINNSHDVFCVGTASVEGVTPAEEARAAQRAGQLAQWVSAVIRNPAPARIFALNAGQYQGPKELQSAYQRKAILIITGPHDDAVELSEGLISGLERQQQASPVIYSLLHHYSRSNEWLKALNGPGEASQRSHNSSAKLAGSRAHRN
jgi:hypothetical protein